MARKRGLGRPRPSLTLKRELFAQEYLKDLSAAGAARRAGYPQRSARQVGHELLRVPAVQTLIQAAWDKLRHANTVTVERVVEELRRLAFSDLGVFFDANGNLRPLQALTEEERSVLASIKVVTRPVAGGEKGDVEYIHEIRSWDKPRALETLARHLGMLLDRTKHEGSIALAPLTQEQAARLSTAELEQIVAIARKAQGLAPESVPDLAG
jgi:phage terminase small subunit